MDWRGEPLKTSQSLQNIQKYGTTLLKPFKRIYFASQTFIIVNDKRSKKLFIDNVHEINKWSFSYNI